MEAKELMVSDLVVNTEFGGKQIGRIECIEPTRVWLQGGKSYTPISYIEPIPLTPEILEKNGLEKDNHGRLYGEYFDEDSSQDLEITVASKTGEVWWSYNWNEYYIIRLRYVHQLQHALRLCGIEKEIEL